MRILLVAMGRTVLVFVLLGLIGLTIAVWEVAAIVFWAGLGIFALFTLFFWMDLETGRMNKRTSSNPPKPRPANINSMETK